MVLNHNQFLSLSCHCSSLSSSSSSSSAGDCGRGGLDSIVAGPFVAYQEKRTLLTWKHTVKQGLMMMMMGKK